MTKLYGSSGFAVSLFNTIKHEVNETGTGW